MYYLFKTKRISKPSEFWNMKLGDKIVIQAFVEKEAEEKKRKMNNLEMKKVPVFSVDVV